MNRWPQLTLARRVFGSLSECALHIGGTKGRHEVSIHVGRSIAETSGRAEDEDASALISEASVQPAHAQAHEDRFNRVLSALAPMLAADSGRVCRFEAGWLREG